MSDAFEARGDLSPAISPEQQQQAPVDASAFAALGLAPELVSAVADLGYTQPTAVQAKVMPLAIKAEGAERYADLMVSSQTGSGKTAAFLLPVLHTLIQQQAARAEAERVERERLVAEAIARGEAFPDQDGKPLRLNADRLCVHGDNPESLAVLRRLRAQLDTL